jgi:hypothetical protein
MGGPSTFELARDALYGADPDGFTERRAELAATAKASGEPLAAKRIAALRRPTRAAVALNRMVRADNAVTERLDRLAAELAAAHRSLDGTRIRDVSVERNRAVADLTKQALGTAGPNAASVALADEIRNTLLAALADDAVRDDVRAGALVRAARWDGFGADVDPGLRIVPPTPISRPAAGTAAGSTQRSTARATQRRAELSDRRDSAEAELREAEAAAAAQGRALVELDAALTAARRRADELLVQVRAARRRRDAAQAALDRLVQ